MAVASAANIDVTGIVKTPEQIEEEEKINKEFRELMEEYTK